MDSIQTVMIRGGYDVLAKLYEGELSPKTFANRSQAENAAKHAESQGYATQILHIGRPFYVRALRIIQEVR